MYMREHLSSFQRTLKRIWEEGRDGACPNNYHVDMWESNVKYWRTPHANRESE
jgi:hypothetical protein